MSSRSDNAAWRGPWTPRRGPFGSAILMSCLIASPAFAAGRGVSFRAEDGRTINAIVFEPSQRPAPAVEGDAALHESRIEAVLGELALAPGAREAAAIVVPWLGFDDEDAGYRRLAEDHGTTATSGIGMTNCPPHSRMYASWAMISCFTFQGRIIT